METQKFDTRLKELSAMCGCDKTDTLFNQEFENLLAEVKADTDNARRYSHAIRLRHLADYQSEFLVKQWLLCNRREAMI